MGKTLLSANWWSHCSWHLKHDATDHGSFLTGQNTWIEPNHCKSCCANNYVQLLQHAIPCSSTLTPMYWAFSWIKPRQKRSLMRCNTMSMRYGMSSFVRRWWKLYGSMAWRRFTDLSSFCPAERDIFPYYGNMLSTSEIPQAALHGNF